MCGHSTIKWRWAVNAQGQKQTAAYCVTCDQLLYWGKKIAGQRSPVQQKLFKK